MRFLMVGDVVGKPGRKILADKLKIIKEELDIEGVVVNGENAAGGLGIMPEVCEEILSYGVDVITTGNHIWDKKEIVDYIDYQPRLIRPLNYPPGVPGRGWAVVEKRGKKWIVANVNGRVFMPSLDCPFQRMEEELESFKKITNIILVDFHAEASSEKVAMGWFLDGRVSCIFGTHTHVATADERILPQGTAYITDIGMTGAHDSVIGVRKEDILNRFLTQMPVRYRVAKENVQLNGIVVEVDEITGRATGISRLSIS
ncbi:MAG TPA: TIGR00282 family metallophosphoesterase [Candidatus Atribacteria bacterium]|nr:TIGR00282 family metallophosphoesterase [Candidatus Atribacteria bacterium]